MDLAQLEKTLADRGEPPYRSAQVWAWAARGAADSSEMTNLPARLRRLLADEVPFTTLALEHEARWLRQAPSRASCSRPGPRDAGASRAQ